MRVEGQCGVYRCKPSPVVGGQAHVFAAIDLSGRKVAVKLSQQSGEAGGWIDNERRAVRQLLQEHPDLVPFLVEIFDWGETRNGRRFVVMPWYEYTLGRWIVGRSLSERLRACGVAARAVSMLHRSALNPRRGVVHRDIKPSNFLTDASAKRVVLADFGSVKRSMGNTGAWNSGFLLTAGYAPPDQLLPRPGALDSSWDTFALAVSIFQCVTGQLPTVGKRAIEMLSEEGLLLRTLWNIEHPSASQRARIQKLGALPMSRLLDFGRADVLLAADLETLGVQIGRLLGADRSSDLGLVALARDIAGELGEPLFDALQSDPANRNPDVRPIIRCCERLASRLGRGGMREAAQITAPPPPAPVTLSRRFLLDSVQPQSHAPSPREPALESLLEALEHWSIPKLGMLLQQPSSRSDSPLLRMTRRLGEQMLAVHMDVLMGDETAVVDALSVALTDLTAMYGAHRERLTPLVIAISRNLRAIAVSETMAAEVARMLARFAETTSDAALQVALREQP